jgi:hypothetical protein
MSDTGSSTAFITLIPAILGALGGMIVAAFNNLSERNKRKTEIRNLNEQIIDLQERRKVELENIQAQTELVNAQTEAVLRAETSQVKERQDKLAEFVLKYLISEPEVIFLKQLDIHGHQGFVEFKDNFRDKDHLRNLFDSRFINKRSKNIAEFKKGDNLCQLLEITEEGKKYLSFLSQLNID